MRTHASTAITAFLATVALTLALTAAAAGARSFSVSEKEWENLFRIIEFNAAGNVISCPLTLLGHFFERTIPKTGVQVGVIRHAEPTNGASPPCTGGTMTVLAETLPWRVNYSSFTGRLPNITSLRFNIIGVAIRVRGSFGNCLAGTTALKPLPAEEIVGTGGGVTGFRFDESARIPLGGGFICEIAGEANVIGIGTRLNLPQNASITVTLI